jgi:signal transduction histidine kinase
MMPSRSSSALALICLLILAAAGLGGLMLGLAGDRKGMQALPDAEGSLVEVLPDAAASFSLTDVRSRPETAWQHWQGRGYIQAFSGGAVWVRVTLRNPQAAPVRGVLADAEYYTDKVDFWTKDPAAEDGWRHERAGEWVPANEKSLWGRDAAFFVSVPARGERVVYLRLQDHFGVWLRPVWWTEDRAFLASQLRDTVAEASYFGILLALVVYNGVVWARLRFRDIGYYLGYLVSIAGFMFVSRSLHQVVGWSMGSPWMEMLITFTLAGSGFFLAQFARAFLELESKVPWADRAARVTGQAMVLLAIAALVLPWMGSTLLLHLAVGGVTLTHSILLVCAIAAWRKDSYHARYFVLSFGLLLAGILPTAIIWLRSIPLGLSAMSMMLGSALEMLLLSLAIADRFARLQQDKLVAQEHAVGEAEKRRVMQEAYADELEHEVHERTRELAAANADKDRMMAVLGHDLRGPLTALTLSAEQAAHPLELRSASDAFDARTGDAQPGDDPRASFAQDAAQTGRALLLLLEDVVLWARLRAGGGKTDAYAVGTLVAPAVELHRGTAERRGIELLLMADPAVRVTTDLVLVQTLVRNLTSNAVKLARRRVVVTVSAEGARGERVRVSVRDDGPGLPPAVLQRLREPTPVRADTANPWGGRGGLGLWLCMEITQAIGTRLQTALPEGGGTEIWFTLQGAEG